MSSWRSPGKESFSVESMCQRTLAIYRQLAVEPEMVREFSDETLDGLGEEA